MYFHYIAMQRSGTGNGTIVTNSLFIAETVGKKPGCGQKVVTIGMIDMSGLRKCVFWLKWVVWLKDGVLLRR